MNVNELTKLKKQLESEEKQLQRNKGKLDGLYDELYDVLNIGDDVSEKEALRLAQKKIKTLSLQIKKEQKRLDTLLDEIEEEVSEWEE